MAIVLQVLFYFILAYLIGSISTAILVCRLLGLPDPRTQGSKNPGATNVLRFGGKKLALIVFLGDTFKGFIVVLILKALGTVPYAVGVAGLGAFLGHLYPVYFRFKGGKGVATAMGVWLAFAWLLGLAAMVVWLVSVLLSRISSLGALTMTCIVPALMVGLAPRAYWPSIIIMCLFLLWRHRLNMWRITQGKEPKIGQKLSKE